MRTRGAFITWELWRKDPTMHCQRTFRAFWSTGGADIPAEENDSVAEIAGFTGRKDFAQLLLAFFRIIRSVG